MVNSMVSGFLSLDLCSTEKSTVDWARIKWSRQGREDEGTAEYGVALGWHLDARGLLVWPSRATGSYT